MKSVKAEKFNINFDDTLVLSEIDSILNQIDIELSKTKASKEKTKFGQMLYSPVYLNEEISKHAMKLGWSRGEKYSMITSGDRQEIEKFLSLPIKDKKDLSLHSNEEPDFAKEFLLNSKTETVFLEIQFGKYAFMTRDNIYKSAYFHKYGYCGLCICIAPMKRVASQMSTGIGCYEKSLPEVVSSDIKHPLILLGIE
jgi:hypothetical protein